MTTAAPTSRPDPRASLHARAPREWTVAVATIVCGGLLAFGWSVREELYWTAERGLGYALGIVGLTALVSLLAYAVRKRTRVFGRAGTLAPWFRVHMLLGIVGPTAILFHANFQLGSINSSVALLSMLGVAASGYVGRFIYARIHRGLFGERRLFAEMQRDAEDGFGAVERVGEILPELLGDLQAHERWALDRRLGVLGSMGRFLTVGARGARLHRRASAGLRETGREDGQFLVAALGDHLQAVQRLAQFTAWERLFSLWHAIHLPLCVLLFGAAAVHVVVVHMF